MYSHVGQHITTCRFPCAAMRYNISVLAGNDENTHGKAITSSSLQESSAAYADPHRAQQEQATGNRHIVGLRRLPIPMSLNQVHPSSISIHFHQARCNSESQTRSWHGRQRRHSLQEQLCIPTFVGSCSHSWHDQSMAVQTKPAQFFSIHLV